MKLLVLLSILLTFSLPVLAKEMVSYSDYQKLRDQKNEIYQDYSDQFDKRVKIQKKYNKLIVSHDRLCQKLGSYTKSKFTEVANRTNTIYKEIIDLRRYDKDTSSKEVTFGLMVLNARIEVDKNKLSLVKTQLKMIEEDCNDNGSNATFINYYNKQVTTYLKHMDTLDKNIESALDEKISQE
jgi:predicted nuclease with TOPRIM domain